MFGLSRRRQQPDPEPDPLGDVWTPERKLRCNVLDALGGDVARASVAWTRYLADVSERTAREGNDV